jgi:hypothetical protein
MRRQRNPDMMQIQCPNCRTVTQVISLNNLPKNEYVFKPSPQMFTMNIFSPYEAAKRLCVESKSLTCTSQRYMQFLERLQEMDRQYEQEVVKNFEKQYQKVESYKKVMIKIITDYTDGVKQKLTEQMAQQRSNINQHLKELSLKMKEIEQIVHGVNIVEQRLQQIQDNEEAYIHKQMQQLQNQIDIEESLYLARNRNDQDHDRWNDDSISQESTDKNDNLKKQSKQQEEKQKSHHDKDHKLDTMNNYSPNSSNRSNEDFSHSSGASSQSIGN